MRSLPLALILSGLVVTAQAAETLPAGVVACVNLRFAKDYQRFAKEAPDFAADLIDRASCYHNVTPTEVVRRGGTAEFTQYQLLSGHKVWVPSAR